MILNKQELTAVLDVNRQLLGLQLATLIVKQDNTEKLLAIDSTLNRIKCILDLDNV